MKEIKKFKLLEDSKKVIQPEGGIGITLYQIEALIDFTDVHGNPIKKGQRGGYVQREVNLSHDGKCWIDQDSIIIGMDACVINNALVIGSEIRNARVAYNAIIVNSNVSKSGISGTVINSTVARSNVNEDIVVINSLVEYANIGQNGEKPVTIADSTISGAWVASNCVITNSVLKTPGNYRFRLYDSNLEKVTYIDPKADGEKSLNLTNKECIMTYESSKPEEAE